MRIMALGLPNEEGRGHFRPYPYRPHGTTFKLYNNLLYTGMPSLPLRPLQIVASDAIWGLRDDKGDFPSTPAMRKFRDDVSKRKGMLVLDIEHLHLLSPRPRQVLQQVLERVKIDNPDLKIGLYSVLPQRDYWRAITSPTGAQYRAWQHENNIVSSLVKYVDVLFPSIYTFYNDPPNWEKYAIANLKEAWRLSEGKSVIPYIWPSYHNSSPLVGQDIGGTFWRAQLDLILECADGAVLWGGWDVINNRRQPWNPNAPWWIETLKFITSHRLNT